MSEQIKELALLTSVPTETEASIIKAAIEAEGLHCAAVGGFTAGFIAEAPGWVKIMVAKRDLDQAKKILQALEEEGLNEEVDWSEVDFGEPEE